MRSSWWLSLVLIFGCVGDPDLPELEGEIELGPAVPRAAWEAAPAGCEDVDVHDATVAAVEGEPALAAVIDRDGAVRCVDALSVIALEVWPDLVSLRAGDPSPQPARPVTYLRALDPIPAPQIDP